jgi:hypothetical protein
MTKTTAHHASRIALMVIWQLVTLITSTHAQAETHSTQDEPSDACTRATVNDGFAGAPVAHFPCLSFEPLSPTPTEATPSLSFSLSEQETSSTRSSFTSVSPSFNSTSDHGVSKTTVYTTLQGNDQATSTSSFEQVQTVANSTLAASGIANTILSQNSTTASTTFNPTTALPKDGGGATNATMFPAVLQTVTYTTTICPSGGWFG